MSGTFLILGGESLVAGYLKRSLPGEVYAPSRSALDIKDAAAFEEMIAAGGVDTVINCAGSATPPAGNARYLYDLNGFYPGRLARICADYGVRFVFISTGRVFDGTLQRPYRETDPVHPVDDYGLSKYLGERCVENALYESRYLIFRIPLTYGIRPYGIKAKNSNDQLLLRLLQQARSGRSVSVSRDAFNSPSYAADIADLIARYLESDLKSGCYHLHNHGVVSIADLVARFFRLLDVTADLKPVRYTGLQSSGRPAANLSFASEKLPRHRSWDAALADFVAELRSSGI